MRSSLFCESTRTRVSLSEGGIGNETSLTELRFITGYIDLSKRRVSPDDIAKCEERYNKSKAVHTIMSHIAMKLDKPLEPLFETIAWPLAKKYGHAADAFRLAVT